jgi:hypothetical protein
MTGNLPIVLKLQADALDQNVSVTDLLRTAKVIANKLGATDALTWIDRELTATWILRRKSFLYTDA